MNKTNSVALIAAHLAIATSCQEAPKVDSRPNIIHIMTDDHSFQTISAYGSEVSKLAPTPNIDRLAKEGMLFTRGYVENSLSTPSRACLMTGLYSHQNGQKMLGKGIDSTKTFVSELMQDAGYQTAVFGKWHMQCEPKGMDEYMVLNDQGPYYSPEFKSPRSNGKYIKEPGYTTVKITDHALEFLDGRDKTKPFCLFVHHKAPHRNWMPEPKYLHAFDDVTFPVPETMFDDYATRNDAAAQRMQISNDMTLCSDLKMMGLTGEGAPAAWQEKSMQNAINRMDDEQRKAWVERYEQRTKAFENANLKGRELIEWKYQEYMKDYLGCIKSVDEQVGRLLDYLDANGLTENTIVVYTSDQGFYMGEHGWFDKRYMYEESFRTPLMIRYPKAIKAGSVCDALVQNIDYAPTYLAAAGADVPEAMVGTPLTPLFGGKTPADWREYLYYHYYDYPGAHYVRCHDGVFDGRYKLINFYGEGIGDNSNTNELQLFDVVSDPMELNNIYGKAGYEDITARLKARIEKFRIDEKVDAFD